MAEFDPIHSNFPKEPWPWWVHEASLELARRLKPTDIVFEWGSGGSTIWLSHRAKYVWSTEHVESYYEGLAKQIEEDEIRNVALVLVKRDEGSFPFAVYSLTGLKDDIADVVLIDGRARVMCVRSAISALKVGGTLLLDDAERPEYRAAWAMLSGWPCVAYCGDVGGHKFDMTALFTKPERVYSYKLLSEIMNEWAPEDWEA